MIKKIFKKIFKIVIVSAILLIVVAGIFLLRLLNPDDIPQGYFEHEAEYINFDYDNFIISLDGITYKQQELKKGWRLKDTLFADENKIAVFEPGNRKYYDTAYFIGEHREPEQGIMLLDFKGDECAYLFPGDVSYPDLSSELPDEIYILTIKDECDISFSLKYNYDTVADITKNIFSEEINNFIPEKIVSDTQISEITIWLIWNDSPYMFEQDFIRNTDSSTFSDFRLFND